MFLSIGLFLLGTFLIISKYKLKISLIWIVLAIAVRLYFIFFYSNISNFDLESYNLVGFVTTNHQDLYKDIAILHHPYLPFMFYLETFAYMLKEQGYSLIIILKLFFSTFDLLICYLIYIYNDKDRHIALLYAFNPITILIFSFHGQFDSIPLFFILLSLYFHKRKSDTISILVYSVAVLVKTWPILISIIFFKNLKNKINIILLLVIPSIFVGIYIYFFHSHLDLIIKTLISYRGIYNIYGLSFISKELFNYELKNLPMLPYIVGGAVLLYGMIYKNKNIMLEILGLLLIIFTVTLTFGVQWLSWLVPFMILTYSSKYLLFIISSTVFLLLSYNSWVLSSNGVNVSDFYKTLLSISNISVWMAVVITAVLFFALNKGFFTIRFIHKREKDNT